jgi:hypothetical protein
MAMETQMQMLQKTMLRQRCARAAGRPARRAPGTGTPATLASMARLAPLMRRAHITDCSG